jgi:sterol desaturase/sphingolipid hydroxylase (fatty acid hydroxylase superfamily)
LARSAFYKRFHKYHHHNKAPEPFDDMLIHPLEAFGYYCILYSPPFLVPMHPASFAAYMVLMGVCGILDHSGVKVCIQYNTYARPRPAWPTVCMQPEARESRHVGRAAGNRPLV